MIRGKKNYVNPQRLELGCTIMFRLDDDSVANHINERRNRLAVGDGQDAETENKGDPEEKKTDTSRQVHNEESKISQEGMIMVKLFYR